MMYSKRRSRREFPISVVSGSVGIFVDGSGCPSPRAERRERRVIQASLSHSVIATESNEMDLFDIPAR